MNLNVLKSAVVITPTILLSKLSDAMESVQNQTYPRIRHLLVKDGPLHRDLKLPTQTSTVKIEWCNLPQNTGNLNSNKFYGHRIYAGFSHLVNEDYVLFLDEDNWYAPDHVRSLIKVLDDNPELSFSYSLREIFSEDRKWLCHDDCESLGLWPIYWSHYASRHMGKPEYLIDTSAFCFRREFLVNNGHHWHSGWGGDRRFLTKVWDKTNPEGQFKTSGHYTLCYRATEDYAHVKDNMWLKGNQYYENFYKGKLPWRHPSLDGVKAL